MRDRNHSFLLFSVFSRVFRCFLLIIQAAPLITSEKRCRKTPFRHKRHLLVTFGPNLRVGRPELVTTFRAFPEKSDKESIGENGAFRCHFLSEKVV